MSSIFNWSLAVFAGGEVVQVDQDRDASIKRHVTMMRTHCLITALIAVLILLATPASAFSPSFGGVSASLAVEEPDTADWRGYFPLAVGNTWQDEYGSPMTELTSTDRFSVSGIL